MNEPTCQKATTKADELRALFPTQLKNFKIDFLAVLTCSAIENPPKTKTVPFPLLTTSTRTTTQPKP